jgi:hypothetical protein
MNTLRLLRVRRAIRTIQGFFAAVLAYSAAHSWMDKDPGMRSVWGWAAGGAIATLALSSLLTHRLTTRLRTGAKV